VQTRIAAFWFVNICTVTQVARLMSKPALGRGLGELMDAKQSDATQVASGTKVYVSAGVQTILQAGNGDAGRPRTGRARAAELPQSQIANRQSQILSPLVRPMLIAADLILIALCGLIAWRAAGAMTVLEGIMCVIAMVTGTVLLCATVLLWPPK
jgi:hypothetical protein